MNAPPAPATGTATTTQRVVAAPIPFRKSSATSGSEVVGVFVTTLLVLAAFAALAAFARRHGWLDRWVGQLPSAPENKRQLVVVETLRVSRKTTVYRVKNGEHEFLLAESSAPLQLSSTRFGPEQLS